MATLHVQRYASDKLVKRNRNARVAVLCAYLILTTGILVLGAQMIAWNWFGYSTVGLYVGLATAMFAHEKLLPFFFVKVGAVRAFTTVDQLESFFHSNPDSIEDISSTGDEELEQLKKTFVVYGPGLHATFPWESRQERYNVSLEEATIDFDSVVMTKDGALTATGSVRLRPDITRVIPFLSGVAVMGSDLADIITAFTFEMLSGKNIDQAIKNLPKLNAELNKKFGLGAEDGKDPRVSKFEYRFGVNVGDVTIANLRMSEEAEKTRNALDESRIIQKGTAIMLGYDDISQVTAARDSGKITQADFDKARDRFMAASENLTMDLKANEYTFKVEGIDPELVQAITAVAPLLVNARNTTAPRRRRTQTQNEG